MTVNNSICERISLILDKAIQHPLARKKNHRFIVKTNMCFTFENKIKITLELSPKNKIRRRRAKFLISWIRKSLLGKFLTPRQVDWTKNFLFIQNIKFSLKTFLLSFPFQLTIDDVILNNSGEQFLQNKEMYPPYKPFKIALTPEGTISHLQFKESDPIWSTNFKRAIASIFQFQIKSSGAFVVEEVGRLFIHHKHTHKISISEWHSW